MKRIKLSQIILCLFLTFHSVSFASSQKHNDLDTWLMIKPLESTLKDVEKMFLIGDAGINNKYQIFYKTDYGGVDVEYALGNCETGVVKKWNVPEWTVINVLYLTHDDPPELKTLLKGMGSYKARTAGDQISQVEFYNEEKGISITYSLTTEEVMEIAVEPTLEQKKKYDCNLLKKDNSNKVEPVRVCRFIHSLVEIFILLENYPPPVPNPGNVK